MRNPSVFVTSFVLGADIFSLTYHANMADIMGLVSSPDSSTYATLAVIIPPWTSIRKVDPYMGLSERFISCLAQVSDLFRVEVTQREDFQKMLSESGKMCVDNFSEACS